MRITKLSLDGLTLIEPKVFGDQRGFFFEGWNQRAYEEAGLNFNFVQDNVSASQKGVLRGLHFQEPNAQGKLVMVLLGEVFDVAVDIRKGSPTFGKWEGVILSQENHRQLFLPPGFAHGFLVLSEKAIFHYKCTNFYSPKNEMSLLWNDPAVAIEWPLEIEPTLSEKDSKGLLLKDIPEGKLPRF